MVLKSWVVEGGGRGDKGLGGSAREMDLIERKMQKEREREREERKKMTLVHCIGHMEWF